MTKDYSFKKTCINSVDAVRGHKGIHYYQQIRVLILCIIAAMLYQACNERRESFYPSLDDAIESGQITRGWIPDFLPESSRAIHVIYDITSSRTWCAFEFSPNDPQRLQQVLVSSVNELLAGVRHVDGPNMSWWPNLLLGDLDIQRIHRNGFALYVHEESSTMDQTRLVLFAIDWAGGHGFFYRTYSK